ncbi:hypothetical protein TI39_contig4319g00002 [Zymoseptoria brevis]|uniref:Exosome complex protein n=1 Tax=Zymoseptoria brevis TaxID=1047168 RepID=A0A0F4G8W7_9PEZI|nr:hypothetical protein TI39_contig4319g00002 [Zymoseptoria brevis]
MDSLEPLLTDLSDTLTNLETALDPLLRAPLSQTTSKLPLLDSAKLYILSVYALESLLFSSLRLSGSDATSHPVFRELARVKEYFAKVTSVEAKSAGGKGRVDVGAAGRMIRAGLAGNERSDRESERKGGKRKLEEYSGVGTHTRFEGVAKRMRAGEEDVGEQVGVVRASEVESSDDTEQEGEGDEQGGKNDTDASSARWKVEKAARKQKKREKRVAKTTAKYNQLLEEEGSTEVTGQGSAAGDAKWKAKGWNPLLPHVEQQIKVLEDKKRKTAEDKALLTKLKTQQEKLRSAS